MAYNKKQNVTLKKAMIEALEKSLGIVTTACKIVNIERNTHYRWMREDENYKNLVNGIEDIAIDFAESKLHTQISKGDTIATIFYLKTKGKKRGYIEKQEITQTNFNVDAKDLDEAEIKRIKDALENAY